MRGSSRFTIGLATAILLAAGAIAQEAKREAPPAFPGPIEGGYLLPNGWRVTPVGQQVLLTDLPLNILTSADGKYAFVATSGYNAHELTAVELATGRKVDERHGPAKLVWPGAERRDGANLVVGRRRGRAALVRAGRAKSSSRKPSYPPAAAPAPNEARGRPAAGIPHRHLPRRQERRASIR